ncbi:zf-HC2 domain-containing protein [Streptacidiphilus griseoplanus]|uniref:zf-HC2 domain-containing protein n=1 Tax=Peterkaempfera griseoplana TaxID=66896 RepID=UPI0006E250B8|nr:zf-HC2 domain-containing protein [Peterkaempfera griseoplana]
MSAERYTGSGRRGRIQSVGKDGAGPEEPQSIASVVALTNVGTGPAAEQSVEEHHLGERLAGFVDGELDHDLRDRVQVHLATCPDCLAEAEDARSVKQLLAESVTPEPSALLLGRLLAIGADRPDGGDSTFGGSSRLDGGSFGRGAGGGPFGGGAAFGNGALGAAAPLPGLDPRAAQAGPLVELRTSTRLRTMVAPPDGRPAGTAVERSPRPSAARGRRFAFAAAAAGAFSVAAVALSGLGALGGVDTTTDEPYGSSVSPVADTGSGNGEISPLNAPVRVPIRAGYPVSVPAQLPDFISASPGSPGATPSPLATAGRSAER